MSENKENNGVLYIVSTPIGNFRDITLHALETLKHCDLIICENYKEAVALLKYHGIDRELEDLNVKNEDEKYPDLIRMIQDGKKLALISDGGTPVFADPGSRLVNGALQLNLKIEVVPGVTSIMTALVRSGFDLDKFYFAGFMPRVSSERQEEFKRLSNIVDTICLLETPYRLVPLLEDASKLMPNRPAYLGFNLTMPQETHHYGSLTELYEKFKDKKVKAEFVLCIQGNHFEKMKQGRFKDENKYKTSKRKF